VEPLFFASPAEWRRWLAAHYKSAHELWVGFHKRASGTPSITWPEAVDEALCYGWIDGLRKSIDSRRYKIRFTPRRAGSIWSAVNVRRVKELTRRRRMRAAGVRAYRARTPAKTAIYSFEQRSKATLPPAYRRQLEANATAWRFFQSQAPWYQRTAIFWVISAKREETQHKRLRILIEDSARKSRIGPLATPPRPRDGRPDR
jgi:uncharacterized protein YdeI (YjbR/CyaY-like superfamily)